MCDIIKFIKLTENKFFKAIPVDGWLPPDNMNSTHANAYIYINKICIY